ncbi:MAG: DUF4198 domain-containing protein [Planctomycetes bacterium]|nr:DUF4198 domain-containing protein [Planctomycetota bacterium]
MLRLLCALTICFGLSTSLLAHDTWVQINTNLIRTGDLVHVDLMLGNHGNGHRDFKLASKIDIGPSTLEVIAPGGEKYDLKPNAIDTGYAPKEGFWSARFTAAEPGLHLVAHTVDRVVAYAPKRTVKSAKTFFVVSESLDRVPEEHSGFDRVLGHPLELVATANPVTPMGPGQPIRVQALYQGKPLSGARIAFIPRGQALEEGFDEIYERLADEQGRASFTPKEGNYYLVVVHHDEPEQKGEGYDYTHYSATLTVFVPQVCPCCGE